MLRCLNVLHVTVLYQGEQHANCKQLNDEKRTCKHSNGFSHQIQPWLRHKYFFWQNLACFWSLLLNRCLQHKHSEGVEKGQCTNCSWNGRLTYKLRQQRGGLVKVGVKEWHSLLQLTVACHCCENKHARRDITELEVWVVRWNLSRAKLPRKPNIPLSGQTAAAPGRIDRGAIDTELRGGSREWINDVSAGCRWRCVSIAGLIRRGNKIPELICALGERALSSH